MQREQTRVTTSRTISAVLLVTLTGCDWMQPKPPPVDPRSARVRIEHEWRLQRACASAQTYDRLKAIAFDEVSRARGAGAPNLDVLAASSTLRMVSPVAKSRDNELNITVCSGRMIVELPPGAEAAFGGAKRLEADVEYAAQEAADGSGLVYRLQGAEPIVTQIAGIDPRRLGADMRTAQVNLPLPPPVRDPRTVAEQMGLPEYAQVEPSPPRSPPVPRPAPLPRSSTEPAPAQTAEPPPPPRVVTRPSFNCRYARSRVENLICADARLAGRDRAMSSAFYAALARGDGATKASLRRSRDRFLRFRDRCPDAACVAQAYSDRVDEIRDIAAGPF